MAKESRKTYNYLTAERLVPVKTVRLPRDVLRLRDDKTITIRRDYKQKLLQDIDAKVHYLNPEIKKFVFFTPIRNRENIKRLFRGNRAFPPRTFTRIYLDILKKITSGARRDELIKLMQEAGISPLPSDDVWRRYTDPKTGDISIGLRYSSYMERYLVRICEKFDPGCMPNARRMSPIQAYILANFSDSSKVPSLEQWGNNLGAIKEEELILSARTMDPLSIVMEQASHEIKSYGREQIEPVVSSMTLEEQEHMLRDVAERGKELYEKMCRHLLFAAQVLLAVNSLPEIKAIQKPSQVFFFEKRLLHVMKQNGSWFPDITKEFQEYKMLSPEEQKRYYCFNSRIGRRTQSGLQLYVRYCTRDYGIGRSEAAHRFFYLSDLQHAALNFPFYYPITPGNASVMAFRKFYIDMCIRYGFSHKLNHNSLGNRLLEGAMRKKWKLLDPSERKKYYEPDVVGPTFPLQPLSLDGLNGAVSSEAGSREPEVSPQDAGMISSEGSADTMDAMKSILSSKDHPPPPLTEESQEGSHPSRPAVWIEENRQHQASDSSFSVRVGRQKADTPQKVKTTEVSIPVSDPYGIGEKHARVSVMVV
ncbi:unnamed protein product [Phytomonas sp. EM1]|nr:unnamed protein product [Phytomonas sp. EM1]|eukprot:CCW62367.1 unnamed protein product [Phytomonas sp. isolate EM1]